MALTPEQIAELNNLFKDVATVIESNTTPGNLVVKFLPSQATEINKYTTLFTDNEFAASDFKGNVDNIVLTSDGQAKIIANATLRDEIANLSANIIGPTTATEDVNQEQTVEVEQTTETENVVNPEQEQPVEVEQNTENALDTIEGHPANYGGNSDIDSAIKAYKNQIEKINTVVESFNEEEKNTFKTRIDNVIKTNDEKISAAIIELSNRKIDSSSDENKLETVNGLKESLNNYDLPNTVKNKIEEHLQASSERLASAAANAAVEQTTETENVVNPEQPEQTIAAAEELAVEEPTISTPLDAATARDELNRIANNTTLDVNAKRTAVENYATTMVNTGVDENIINAFLVSALEKNEIFPDSDDKFGGITDLPFAGDEGVTNAVKVSVLGDLFNSFPATTDEAELNKFKEDAIIYVKRTIELAGGDGDAFETLARTSLSVPAPITPAAPEVESVLVEPNPPTNNADAAIQEIIAANHGSIEAKTAAIEAKKTAISLDVNVQNSFIKQALGNDVLFPSNNDKLEAIDKLYSAESDVTSKIEAKKELLGIPSDFHEKTIKREAFVVNSSSHELLGVESVRKIKFKSAVEEAREDLSNAKKEGRNTKVTGGGIGDAAAIAVSAGYLGTTAIPGAIGTAATGVGQSLATIAGSTFATQLGTAVTGAVTATLSPAIILPAAIAGYAVYRYKKDKEEKLNKYLDKNYGPKLEEAQKNLEKTLEIKGQFDELEGLLNGYGKDLDLENPLDVNRVAKDGNEYVSTKYKDGIRLERLGLTNGDVEVIDFYGNAMELDGNGLPKAGTPYVKLSKIGDVAEVQDVRDNKVQKSKTITRDEKDGNEVFTVNEEKNGKKSRPQKFDVKDSVDKLDQVKKDVNTVRRSNSISHGILDKAKGFGKGVKELAAGTAKNVGYLFAGIALVTGAVPAAIALAAGANVIGKHSGKGTELEDSSIKDPNKDVVGPHTQGLANRRNSGPSNNTPRISG